VKPRVERLPDAAAVAEAGAARFVAAAEAAIAARGRFLCALAGGGTPRATYRLLATRHAARVDWGKLEVFFGDERTVPPAHPDANYRMAKEALLDHVPIDPARVHRMEGERDPAEAARDYAARLEAIAGQPPRLDFVFLGLGADGHTASLFPGTRALLPTDASVIAVEVPQLATFRITLTAPVLSAAAQVVFLVEGAGKAEALRRCLEAPPGTVPAQLVAPAGGAVWLVDRAAAAALQA
jgi:6-phosphogluconolactonase